MSESTSQRVITRAEAAPYQRLALAIVEQATKDFIKARRKGHIAAALHLAKFFHSPWYRTLCDIPPGPFLKSLPKKVVRKTALVTKDRPTEADLQFAQNVNSFSENSVDKKPKI